MDLLKIQPNRLSRDLSGFTCLLSGEPKIGKTTLASNFPSPLFLATEIGYREIPGVKAININTYSTFKEVLMELRKPAVQEAYKTIVIDSFDNLVDMANRYAASQLSGDGKSYAYAEDVPFARGRARLIKMLNDSLNSISQLGYAVILTTHTILRTERDPRGREIQKWVSSLESRPGILATAFVSNIFFLGMEDGERFIYTRGTENYQAGSRYKYLAEKIPLNFAALQEAIFVAIEKREAEADFNYADQDQSEEGQEKDQSFEEIMKEFDSIAYELSEKDETYLKEIVSIIEEELGYGGKVANLNPHQKDVLKVIVAKIKRLKEITE